MVPAILSVHEQFLDELKKRLDTWDALQKVGDAFGDVVRFLKILTMSILTVILNLVL